ncbi:hypothetical protein M501DRAFT_936647 [Patellaria atrata CBS 101060]|uniref:H-type lectin domain-containing protein n=1 Tax=Patellaria atrata CBS 101060 TaxID=1346257 RepID=A0A9P4VRP4_9PEZI|nr:hypothetical protein M501DRAFT_936647 [Patellaria atrata CBS 101060]
MVHLSTPGSDTGFFSTLEVHSHDEPSLHTSRLIALPKGNYKEPPSIAAGFKLLDLSRDYPLRASINISDITTSQLKVGVDSNYGMVKEAAVQWLEHKTTAKECQSGSFDTQNENWTLRVREAQKEIRFAIPFKVQPEVIVWFNRVDLDVDQAFYRLSARATNVSTTGFTAHLDTWGDSTFSGAGLTWIAFPKTKPKVASGTIGTSEVRSFFSTPEQENFGEVAFAQPFLGKPTVLIALNMFDIKGGTDLRIKVEAVKITKKGFKWGLHTWEDTKMVAASASWIALGF